MSLTPLDIENKEFKKAVRGYNIDEVESYLDRILKDYEKLYKENQSLKNELEMLNKQLESYKNLENDLKETLLIAQKTSDDVKKNAEKEAEMIYEKAVSKAKNIIKAAEEEAKRKEDEIYKLHETFIKYRSQMKSLLQVQLDLLNNNFVDSASSEEHQAVVEESAATEEDEFEEEITEKENDDKNYF